MPYNIKHSYVIYDSGRPEVVRLRTAISQAETWIRTYTDFVIEPRELSFTASPTLRLIGDHYWIDEYAIPWTQIPSCHWVFVFWHVRGLPMMWAGGTYPPPLLRSYGLPDSAVLEAIPYGWDYEESPFEGFPSYIVQRFVHEWIHGLEYWVDFKIGSSDQCSVIAPGQTQNICNQRIVAQLTPSMYSVFAGQAPSLLSYLAPVLGLGLVLGMVSTVMRGEKSVLAQVLGTGLPQIVKPQTVSSWVNNAWRDVVALIQKHYPHHNIDVDISMLMEKGIITPMEASRYKTLLAGYYLISMGGVPDYVVNETYLNARNIWRELVGTLKLEPGQQVSIWVPVQEAHRAFIEAEGLPFGMLKGAVADTDAFKKIVKAEDGPTRLNRIVAIDAFFHVAHEMGGAAEIGTGVANVEVPVLNYSNMLASILSK